MPSAYCAAFDVPSNFFSLDGDWGGKRESRVTGWLPLRAALDVRTWDVSPWVRLRMDTFPGSSLCLVPSRVHLGKSCGCSGVKHESFAAACLSCLAWVPLYNFIYIKLLTMRNRLENGMEDSV